MNFSFLMIQRVDCHAERSRSMWARPLRTCFDYTQHDTHFSSPRQTLGFIILDIFPPCWCCHQQTLIPLTFSDYPKKISSLLVTTPTRAGILQLLNIEFTIINSEVFIILQLSKTT